VRVVLEQHLILLRDQTERVRYLALLLLLAVVVVGRKLMPTEIRVDQEVVGIQIALEERATLQL
jgi:hypothetical protein